MNEQLLTVVAGFWDDAWPALPCPTCGATLIVQDVETLETAESASHHQHDSWEPDWIDGSFEARLRCSAKGCKEITLVVGDMDVRPVKRGKSWHGEYGTRLTPRYFHPPLRVPIELASSIPPDAIEMISAAMAVIWVDPDAAANRLRSAIEVVLDDRGVRKTATKKNGGRTRLTTHARVKIFGKKQADAGELLEAVKWIGNEGSHTAGLTGEQVFEGMELLAHALTLLYDRRPEELQRRAKQINRRKGRT